MLTPRKHEGGLKDMAWDGTLQAVLMVCASTR